MSTKIEIKLDVRVASLIVETLGVHRQHMDDLRDMLSDKGRKNELKMLRELDAEIVNTILEIHDAISEQVKVTSWE